jgi:hypothetical protein
VLVVGELKFVVGEEKEGNALCFEGKENECRRLGLGLKWTCVGVCVQMRKGGMCLGMFI